MQCTLFLTDAGVPLHNSFSVLASLSSDSDDLGGLHIQESTHVTSEAIISSATAATTTIAKTLAHADGCMQNVDAAVDAPCAEAECNIPSSEGIRAAVDDKQLTAAVPNSKDTRMENSPVDDMQAQPLTPEVGGGQIPSQGRTYHSEANHI